MLMIDGSMGEGGGQVLRTSLSLSLATGTPFHIEKIRAGRRKPGLLRQHRTAVLAAAAIGGAELESVELRSESLTFAPKSVTPGEYEFSVGSAGSVCLVLQAVLPPLLLAAGPSRLTIGGGTHTTFAPPFDFVARVLVPLLARMGAKVRISLDRPGFIAAGGGRMTVEIDPVEKLAPLTLVERGDICARRCTVWVAHIPRDVALREVAALRSKLGWEDEEFEIVELSESAGPGNVIMLELESEGITELFTGIGERGRRAEAVANRVAGRVWQYVEAGAPVGRYLADQLLVPLALAGGGRFMTAELTAHTRTNMQVIERFLPVRFESKSVGEKAVEVKVLAR